MGAERRKEAERMRFGFGFVRHIAGLDVLRQAAKRLETRRMDNERRIRRWKAVVHAF